MKKSTFLMLILLLIFLTSCKSLDETDEIEEIEQVDILFVCDVYFGNEVISYSEDLYDIDPYVNNMGASHIYITDKQTDITIKYYNTPFKCYDKIIFDEDSV